MSPHLAQVDAARTATGQARWLIKTADTGPLAWFAAGREFDTSAGIATATGQVQLYGCDTEALTLRGGHPYSSGEVEFIENGRFLAGVACLQALPGDLEETTRRIYRQIIDQLGGRQIYRFWNYVPDINGEGAGRMENYRLFCRGRARAFSECYGEDPAARFPAASATGNTAGTMMVVFLAGDAEVRNLENPEQTPAYRYPLKYGPEPPSFARASSFTDPEGGEWTFIAGTAAIKGSETQHPGNFTEQLSVTLDNLRLMRERTDSVRFPGRKSHLKVYLRNRDNLDKLLDRLGDLPEVPDSLSVVEAAICRSDLEVEIEISFVPPR